MPRKPEIGKVQLYPLRPLRQTDKNGYVLKFYCPIQSKRIRKSCGTRDRRKARRVLRECQKRLINGEYVESGGAITKAREVRPAAFANIHAPDEVRNTITWEEASEKYRAHKGNRHRDKSSVCLRSHLGISGRVFKARLANSGMVPEVTLAECMTLEGLEYLQDRLLEGEEGIYDYRSPITVNSITGDVMAFTRYCCNHEWISKVPPLKDLDEDEPMQGRPITGEEFERVLACTAKVVGDGAASSWNFLLKVLWESGFRVADVLNFYWDDETKIHPRWAVRRSGHSTIIIPSTQKNKKHDEIPMLPGLEQLLTQVPQKDRIGEVIKLLQVEYAVPGKRTGAFCPGADALDKLIVDYSNCAIAAAFDVSEQAVRKWLKKFDLKRREKIRRYGEAVPTDLVEELKKRKRRRPAKSKKLSKDRVSRVISAIGEEAGVVVRQPDASRNIRKKFASAHDLRRSLAERLFNKGVSAETLMVVMRHRDFATTRKFYAAKRRADSAAAEIATVLGRSNANPELVGGLVGGKERPPELSAEEVLKLKCLLDSL